MTLLKIPLARAPLATTIVLHMMPDDKDLSPRSRNRGGKNNSSTHEHVPKSKQVFGKKVFFFAPRVFLLRVFFVLRVFSPV